MSNWLFPENNGEQDWPSGCSLQYVSGDKLTNQTQIPVPPLPAMAQTDGKFKIKSNASQKDIAFSISWIDVTRSNRFIQYKMEFGDVTWCTFWRAHLVNCSSWGRWHFDCYPNDWPNVKIFKIESSEFGESTSRNSKYRFTRFRLVSISSEPYYWYLLRACTYSK